MVHKNEQMIDNASLTPLGIKILAFLARYPGNRFYVREIAKKINGSVGGSHKVLKSLNKKGLINKYPSGRNLYYEINEKNPAVQYFKIFINIQSLTRLVGKIKDKCREIVLFGSCSAGEDTQKSDIDLFVLTEDPDSVRKSIKGGSISGRMLNAILKKPTEFLANFFSNRKLASSTSLNFILLSGNNLSMSSIYFVHTVFP